MTIYVCQELEQNRAPLQQKRDGGGDSSLCGELWGPLPSPGPLKGVGKVTGSCSSGVSPLAENVSTDPPPSGFVRDEFLLHFLPQLKCVGWKSSPQDKGSGSFPTWGTGSERGV